MSTFDPAKHPRGDADGRFTETNLIDPGADVLADAEAIRDIHHGFTADLDETITSLKEKIGGLQQQVETATSERNRHVLASTLLYFGVPADARMPVLARSWRESGRFDVTIEETYSPDGNLIGSIDMGYIEAGLDGYLGATDWDEFKDDDGRIAADKVYEWAAKAREAGQA